MTKRQPEPRSAYATFIDLPTRWLDNDEYGHMNNATYLSLIDTAVSLWQLNNGLNIRGPEKLRFLVIETGIRYFSEAGFPDLIHAGLRLGHLGNSSLRFEVGLFRNDEDQTCAEGFFAEVLTDNDSQPIPIPDPVRAKLTPLILG